MVIDGIQHNLFFFLQTVVDRLSQRPGAIFRLIEKLLIILLWVLIVRQAQAVNSILGLQQVNQIVTVLKVDCIVANAVE